MERYTPLRTLYSRINDEIICVRVARLWYHRGGTDKGPVKDIHMVVVDIQGDALHAVVPHGFFHQFIHDLHETNVYEISKFLLIKKQEVMRPVDMPFGIMITRSTVLTRRADLVDVYPEWSYSLTPISSLPAPTFVIYLFIICVYNDAFICSLEEAFQPIAHAPTPYILSRRTQVGVDWPRKKIAQLAVFNLFENKDFMFRCTVTVSRVHSRKQWWYVACQRCHRISRPTGSGYGSPTYVCSDPRCPSTTADINYLLSVIALDQTGEAEFTLFGPLAEQVIGCSIHRVIRNNQLSGPTVVNAAIAATQVRFPPPEISRIFGNKYRFVVSVTEASFSKQTTSLMVRRVEAVFPKVRRLSSADTVIPATSWDVHPPKVQLSHSAQNLSPAEPGPSDQADGILAQPVVVVPVQANVIGIPQNDPIIPVPHAVNYLQGAANRQSMSTTTAGYSTKMQLGNMRRQPLSPDVAALNRKKRKLLLDGLRGAK